MKRTDAELTVRLAGSTFKGAFEYNGATHLLFDAGGVDRVVRVDGGAQCLGIAESADVLARRLSAVESSMVEAMTLQSVRRDPRVPVVAEQPKKAAKVADDMRRASEVDDLLSSRRRVSKTLGTEEVETGEFMPGYVSDISRTDSERQRTEVRDTRLLSEVSDIR